MRNEESDRLANLVVSIAKVALICMAAFDNNNYPWYVWTYLILF